MAGGQRSNNILVPQARAAMDQFKYEVAAQIGLNVKPGDYWGDIPSRLNGAVGGHMVRQMVQAYQQNLAGGGSVQATTQAQPSSLK
jgi:small acid-soluble spore protein B (major beta-type SASP)